jgi:chromosome segregation ATPase
MAIHKERLDAEYGRERRGDRLPRQPVYENFNWVEDDLEDRVRLIGSSLNRDMNRLSHLLQRDRDDVRQTGDWQARIDRLDRDLKASITERDALRTALKELEKRSAQENDVAHQVEALQKQLSEKQSEIQNLNKQVESQATMLAKKDSLLQKQSKVSHLKAQKEKAQLEEALEKALKRAAASLKKARNAESERDEAQKKVEVTKKKLLSSRNRRLNAEDQVKTLEKQVKELKDELSRKKEKKRRSFW